MLMVPSAATASKSMERSPRAVGPIGFTVSGSRSDSVTGFGDLYRCLR